MTAFSIDNPSPIEYRLMKMVELDVPEPGPGEVRVKVAACGVCHTDLHEAEGDIKLPKIPITPGHEIVGFVDKLGEGVSAPAVGARVGIPWLASTCGTCRYCLRGRENLCESIRFTGFHVDGGYAQYAIARAGFCYSIPERFSSAEAAPLLCAGVIGFRALRRSGITEVNHKDAKTQPGRAVNDRATGSPDFVPSCLRGESPRLGLYGFGASAHICLQIAQHRGYEVAVFTRAETHREHALEMGASWVGSAEDNPPWPLDSSIIFAPAGELVPVALRHLDKGGTLALAGIHMTPIPAMDYSLVYDERTIRSVANSTRQDVIDLLRLADEIPLRTTVEVFPLEAAHDAMLAVRYSRTKGAAVLIVTDTD